MIKVVTPAFMFFAEFVVSFKSYGQIKGSLLNDRNHFSKTHTKKMFIKSKKRVSQKVMSFDLERCPLFLCKQKAQIFEI